VIPVRRVLAAGAVVLVVVLGLCDSGVTASAASAPSVAGAAVPGAPPAPGSTRVRKVLVLSLPAVTWADIEAADAPNLDRLFRDSSVADLLTRAGGKRFSLGNGYATIGAGTRAVAPDRVAGEGYGASEPVEGGTAGEVFARRTGLHVDDGLVQLGVREIVRANAAALYDASVGALADTLDRNGLGRAVIGNADGVEAGTVDAGVLEVQRPAVAGLMGGDGTVPRGRVDAGLLRSAPRAPFGVLLSPGAVERAFADAWDAPGVVLVEASDLLRADEYRAFATPGVARRQRNRAIAHTDEIVGRLMKRVDPTRDAVVVTAPLASRSSGGLAVTSIRAPGIEPGLLKSATTRRSGFVDIVDVAPTVLSMLGVERPGSMEGRVMTAGSASADPGARIGDLVQASRDSVFRDKRQGVVALTLVLLCAALAAGAALALSRFRRALPVVEWAALGVLGFLLATYLAAPFHFVDHGGEGAYWAFLFGFGAVFAALCTLLGRRSFCDALIVALGATVVLHVVDLVTGARLELNTVFGYSPTVGIRVAGEGNLTFSVLSSATLLFAGLVAWRVRAPVGKAVAITVLAVVLLVMMAPMFGQDFGASAAAPGFVLLVWLILGRRIRWRTVIALAAVLVVSGLAIGFVDLLRPAEQRTHVGRFFEQVGRDGLGGLLLVVRRKAGENLSTFGHTVFVWMVPVVIGFAVLYLLLARPGAVAGLVRRITTLKATVLALCVTAVLGYLLNDSGVAIPAMMAVVAECAAVFLVAREQRRVPEPSPTGEAARRELGLRGRLATGRPEVRPESRSGV
jgi:hypothetical protein